MRLSEPRIAPLGDDEITDDQQEILAPIAARRPLDNVYRTLARHPKLFKRWLVFANHVLFKSSLPAREREMAILRTGYLCRAGYEWGQHVRLGKAAGLTDGEIAMIAEGPGAPGWSPLERALLTAVDELHADAFISDATWRVLSGAYDEAQLMDLVFAVGQYTLVSMALNSLGVQLDDGLVGLPD